MDQNIKINLAIDPVGTLRVEWMIPSALAKGIVRIHLPGFKYDLPRIGGIHVPLSSKAISLSKPEIEINLKSEQYQLSWNADLDGNYCLNIELKRSLKEDLRIKYSIQEIVNNDTIYYVVVYPLINLFSEPVSFDVHLSARFSYNIRKYKFREWYFNRRDGTRLSKDLISKTKKVGDLILSILQD